MQRAALACVVVAACGIDAVGVAPQPPSQVLPDGGAASEDASAPSPDGAAACVPITTNTPGSLVAPRVATPPTIDGDLSDWSACFVTLDETTAYQVRRFTPALPARGEFSVVHDGAKIYVAARVTGVPPLGDNDGPEIYENDSVEVYLDADGLTEPGYGPDALQVVVDHAGRVQGFKNQAATPSPGARAAARSDGTRYTIELELSAETFAATAFSNVVGFDIALSEGDGDAQRSNILWFQKCRASTGCACANGEDGAYCDSRQFGSVMLAP